MTWDALRKSINGLVNKINASNIKHILPEVFNEVRPLLLVVVVLGESAAAAEWCGGALRQWHCYASG